MKFIKPVYYTNYLVLILCTVLATGCIGTRFLKEDEKVLYKQRIKGNENISSSKLENYYLQRPNARVLYYLPFSPYVFLYEWGERNYNQEALIAEKQALSNEYENKIVREQSKGNDRKAKRLKKKKEKEVARLENEIENGNWRMRNGEPLVVYDSSLIQKTEEQMELYYNSRGFFSASINHRVKNRNKRVYIDYVITENNPHRIDSLTYNTGNDGINQILRENQRNSLLVIGDIYNQENLSKERERIELLLKNNGYYAFSRQYIEYFVYKKPDNKSLTIETVIRKPKDAAAHQVYRIDSVNFITDANLNMGTRSSRQILKFNDINYQYYELKYKKRVLDQKVFIRQGNIYRRDDQFETQRQLGNLDIFKFIQIRYDTIGTNIIANIYVSPLERFTASNELGVNVTQGFPGPFYNLSFKNRNTFKRLEILSLNLRAGIEGVPAFTETEEFLRSQELSANLALTFPRFIIPLSYQLKSRVALLNPKTTLLAGYNFTSRPEFTRNTLNSSFSYAWQSRKNVIHNFTLLEVSQINSILDPAFDSLLHVYRQAGNQLFRAFNPSFVSSTYLNTIINFGGYGSGNKKASFLRLFQEHGGTYVPYLVNNEIVDTSRTEYYQFIKLQADYRTYRPLGKKASMAWRLNVGVGRPYGAFSSNVLPYEKYFFAGGSSSVRAWIPRRLGPGSFTPATLENGQFDYRFEQPGEILLEGSIEFRRPLFSVFNGVIFADMGNTWTFSEDNRPGGQISENFWREIALGMGVGLRLDFSFLILRTDFGFKAHDPARPQGDRWVMDKINFRLRDNYGPVLNIGIGYPF